MLSLTIILKIIGKYKHPGRCSDRKNKINRLFGIIFSLYVWIDGKKKGLNDGCLYVDDFFMKKCT